MKVALTFFVICLLAVGVFLISKEFSKEPIPPSEPPSEEPTPPPMEPKVPANEQVRMATAVKSWLQAGNYQVKKNGNKYIVTRNGSRMTLSNSAVSAVGDILITTDENGNLKIDINNIGTAIFKVDPFGKLEAIIKH